MAKAAQDQCPSLRNCASAEVVVTVMVIVAGKLVTVKGDGVQVASAGKLPEQVTVADETLVPFRESVTVPLLPPTIVVELADGVSESDGGVVDVTVSVALWVPS